MIKRRSLLALTGLDLLTSAVLAACSPKGGRASADATGSQFLDALHVHTPTTLAYAAPMTSFGT